MEKHLISEGEWLDEAKEGAIPDRYGIEAHHEYDDSHQVADRVLPEVKEYLQLTKTDADRHQER